MSTQTPVGHVLLLGDSIFDNGAYVPGQPDVIRQLRDELPSGWQATLLAIDGAVCADVPRQLSRLPADASLLAVSAGGNDALMVAGVLEQGARTVGEALLSLASLQAAFAGRYHAMLDQVVASGIPLAVCTIYDANFPAQQGVVIRAALTLFNDVITRAAFGRGLTLIDLRLICSKPADYANPIEPSAAGGAKIARAISRLASGTAERSDSRVLAC
jgi:hypothetical protein